MKYFLSLLFLCGLMHAKGQKLPEMMLNRVRLTLLDKVIVAEILPVSHSPETYTDRLYYWYSANMVHTTQGGFSGKLLNGTYICYYANKNPEEQGTFKKGLKDGVWKKWTEQGVLIETITWRDGWKAGQFRRFNDQGTLLTTGFYRKNLLNGTVFTYLGADSVQTQNYKAGQLQPARAKSSFWQRWPFRKKSQTGNATSAGKAKSARQK